MFCEKCGNEIAENEKFCSQCGGALQNTVYSVRPDKTSETKKSKMNIENAMETMTQAVSTAAEGARDIAQKGKSIFDKSSNGADTVVKKYMNSQNKAPFIIGGVAFLLLIILVLNFATVSNFVFKTFMSPEKYYQHVEKKTVSDLADLGGELYQTYILDSMNFYDRSGEVELNVNLSEDGQELLEMAGLAGVDLSWVQATKIGVDASVKDSIYSIGFSTNLNSDDIVSGSMILDLNGEGMYLQFPELSKKYMGFDLGEMLGYSYPNEKNINRLQRISECNEAILKAMPGQAKIERLIEKYFSVALDCVTDVSKKEKKVLKAEKVQQNCTELKVVIDGETLREILCAVLEEAQTDKELEKVIIEVANQLPVDDIDSEEVYAEYLSAIEYMLDNIEYYYDEDLNVVMKVYVDGKGEIRGRKIQWNDYGYESTINILMPENGNKYGFELSVESYRESISLEGTGKKSGNKLDGEFRAKYQGTTLMEVMVDGLNTKELKLGRVNGNFEISPSSKIMDVVGSVYGASFVKDIKLNLDTQMNKKSCAFALGVTYNEDKLGTVSIAAKSGNGSKTSTPSIANTIFIEDEESVMEWVESVDWNKVATRLEKTDLPSKVIDIIEELGEATEDGKLERLIW